MRLGVRRRDAVKGPAARVPTAGDTRTEAFVEPLKARPVPPFVPPGSVSAELAARVPDAAAAEVERRLTGAARALWDETPVEHRHVLMLIFGALYDVPGVLEPTGLVRAAPPADVHAMAHGDLAYAGDPVLADLVADTFAAAGLPLPAGAGTLLDFGCSSGRVLRVLAAYRPDLTTIGCDPNADAVAWAAEHLPVDRFFASPTSPPLDVATATVDRAYAISIWSHFDAASGAAWLEELHRVIRPGGALLLTTHGLDTLGDHLRTDRMTPASAAQTAEALLRDGFMFHDVFGDDGDWGVSAAGWGNSYTAVDRLAAQVTPAWSIRLFRPGGLGQNQDVFVLERRADLGSLEHTA